jgi:hypothetical protein
MAPSSKTKGTASTEDKTNSQITDESQPEVADNEATTASGNAPKAPDSNGSDRNIVKKLARAFWRHKKVTLPTLILLIVVPLVLPVTRYALLGLVVKKDLTVQVVDSGSSKPISGADVSLRGITLQTNNDGKATFHAPVGKATLSVHKKYFKTLEEPVFVPLGKAKGDIVVRPVATGRQVAAAVINKISGQPIENAVIAAAGTEYKTDKSGKVTLVLPADKQEVEATLTHSGFNDLKTKIQISATSDKENLFELVKSGKVYFLSKQSGKLDVVKTNLDGSERQTVLAGTGKEEDGATVLLPSPDGGRIFLKIKRDTPRASLYVIDTATDKLIDIDTGDSEFSTIGWIGQYFMYSVSRYNVSALESKQQSIKSYDAKANKLITLDDNRSESLSPPYTPICFPACQEVKRLTRFDPIVTVGNRLVYFQRWEFSQYFPVPTGFDGKRSAILSINPDGTDKKTLKDFDAQELPDAYLKHHEPNELLMAVHASGKPTSYYELKDGMVKDINNGQTQFEVPHPLYLASPTGKEFLWHERRDGKNVIFMGTDRENGKEIARLSEYIPYGWYDDNYLLLSKDNSQLYVMHRSGLQNNRTPLKIADYHLSQYYRSIH